MIWQCRCCGYMTPDNLRISSHMKEYHGMNFTADVVSLLSAKEKERMTEMSEKWFENSFASGSDVVKYSEISDEKGL